MSVIYPAETHREIPESMIIRQADDAWHPLKNRNYIEWWYFDVMNGDGSIVRGQLFISGDISRPGRVITGARATYVEADGTENTIEEKFPYSSFKSSTESCDVTIAKNFIKGDLSHYALHIEDSDKSLDLELDSKMVGFTSHACFGDETKCMYWVVPQPRGQARGKFQTRGKTFAIDGLGYRDHNWLNFYPLNVIKHWDWGRVYDKEFTIIFADIVTTKKYKYDRIKPLIIYDSSKFIYLTTESNKWSLDKTDMKRDRITKLAIPERHMVNAHDRDLSLELNLHLEKVFQRIDLLADYNPLVRWLIRTFIAKPTATSYYSTGSGKLNLGGQQMALTCTAVHELVRNT
jgi:hypothetical protein